MADHDEFGPEKVLEVYDQDTGMRGFTVIDNTALGPAKGGIRMTSSVTVEEVARLARAMTWKCAIAELPFGGGKSGIVADGKRIEKSRKNKIIKAFAKAIKPVCPSLYVAAPDIYMAEEDMAVFAKANGSIKSATGKPADMCRGHSCGIPHELGSTGYGVYHAALVAAKHLGLDIKKLTFSVEGFGNVGTFAAKYLAEKGAKLVAVSDSKGCIYNKNGLDYKKLVNIKIITGSVVNYPEGEKMESDDIVGVYADIFIPAAKPDIINEKNKNKVKAKIIVEGANIPIAPETEKWLWKKGVLVVPDFVANAGGVISSYVEYIGAKQEKVFPMVEKKIAKNTRIVLEHSKNEKISPREAGLEIAMARVKKAMKERKENDSKSSKA